MISSYLSLAADWGGQAINVLLETKLIYLYTNSLATLIGASYLWCLVRLYLQMFVEGLKSYLRYLCLLMHSGIQHILCCVFCFVCLRRLVYPMSASFSGLSSFDCLFGIL